MARIRSIKPDFWSDEKVIECSPSARLLFVGLLNFCDDHGNTDRNPKQAKTRVFPADNIDCEPLILELLRVELMVEYQAEDGRKYLHVKNFRKHQKIDKPSKPLHPLYDPSARTSRVVDEHSSRTPLRKGEGEGVEKEGTEAARADEEPSKLETFQDIMVRLYPPRMNPGSAIVARALFEKEGSLPTIEKFTESLELWSRSEAWKDEGGRYVPKPDKFIREEGWNTSPPESNGSRKGAPMIAVETTPETIRRYEQIR